MLKVLFAGLKYDYGRVGGDLSVEYSYFYDALRRMDGVEAEFFAIDEEAGKLSRDGTNKLLLNTVKERQPHLLFCYLLDKELDKGVIAEITQKTNTKTFNWFADDHWRVPVFSRFWAPLFTLVSTTDGKAVELYKKYGITNVVKTQWGANQHLSRPQSGTGIGEPYDITFVGKKFGKRGGYIKSLRDAGLPVRAFGNGWPLGALSREPALQVYSGSKISLNFSETHYAGPKAWLLMAAKLFLTKSGGRYYFTGHHLVDNIRSLRGVRRLTIKARVFEVPACGGFLLTGKMDDDISEYYVPGKEIMVFNNVSDLIEKSRYYLEYGAERDKIAQAGLARTLKEHTYEQRFKAIFRVLGFNF
jgi:spore maturation protein CgeB